MGVALLLPLAALAQARGLQGELAQCAAIADIGARVACYDALARAETQKLPAAPEMPKAAAVAPRPVVAPPAVPPPVRAERDAQPEADVVSTVTSVKEILPNRLRIVLASGQVWQQSVARSFFLRTGDSVRITASGWGRGYRLAVEGHADYIQVMPAQ